MASVGTGGPHPRPLSYEGSGEVGTRRRPAFEEGRGEEVFLTGGTGFVGGHVLAALLGAGYRVRALVRGEGGRLAVWEGCVPVAGDLLRPGELVAAMEGCRYLVHVAALYSFAPRERPLVWATNVAGTKGLLEAARLAGVERVVVTSSSAAVGPAVGGRPATEDDHPPADPAHDRHSAYHASKVAQEQVALAAQLPVVLLLPTAPVGPGDWKPTPTGQIIRDFQRGKIFASVRGGINLVPVEDVAQAHVTALTQGRPGERYLLGGQNYSFDELWQVLAGLTGRPAPSFHLPHEVALALAWGDELRCRVSGGQPFIPLEGVHMSSTYMFADSSKAQRELGFQASPVPAALGRALDWYARHRSL